MNRTVGIRSIFLISHTTRKPVLLHSAVANKHGLVRFSLCSSHTRSLIVVIDEDTAQPPICVLLANEYFVLIDYRAEKNRH